MRELLDGGLNIAIGHPAALSNRGGAFENPDHRRLRRASVLAFLAVYKDLRNFWHCLSSSVLGLKDEFFSIPSYIRCDIDRSSVALYEPRYYTLSIYSCFMIPYPNDLWNIA